MIVDTDHANDIAHKIKESNRKLNIFEAISMIIDANLTKAAYQSIRLSAPAANHDIYPDYKKVF